MLFDQISLLLALGFCAGALGVTLLGAWYASRSDIFLLYLGVGVMLLVIGIAVFSNYAEHYSAERHMVAFVMLILGFSAIWGSARRFMGRRSVLRFTLVVATLGTFSAAPFFIAGFDGLGAIIANLLCMAFQIGTAYEFWRGRREAPVPMLGVGALYLVNATSFGLCALALMLEGDMVLAGAPSNRAEDLNALISIFSMSGIGALSLALNQTRLARRHRDESLTDALTGLLNRRALFQRHEGVLESGTVVLICDLDLFKAVNDRFGHAAGDVVLMEFAETARACLANAKDAVSARLGGEEFAFVYNADNTPQAVKIAERVREAAAAQTVQAGEHIIRFTISAGLAIAKDGERFETVLDRADAALYSAKRSGRNQVSLGTLHLVA
ncbi:GGDEF domain-containing protein [Devosia pacifica]|uniref:diguanylate cyclase n=1 Tax=Devosia pacifica TaxID=1335967 RepID=A0A918S778_9HYPH|nr:GGDEF domain-containing protein [Devosia pacifica]GHA26550.1 GGDEF domain-containing protein [Devosia pacifica]